MYIENLDVVLVLAFCSVIVGAIANIFMSLQFFKWFWYGMVLFPIAVVHLMVIGISDATGARAPKIGALLVFFFVCGGSYYILQDVTGFHQEDIEAIKQSIKSEFEKQAGVKVNHVSMIKDGNRHLIGFADIAVLGVAVNKSCEANMGDDSQYLWTCK